MEENPKVIQNPNEILCYDKYKLGRVEGKFSLDMKKLINSAIPMTREVAGNYNNVSNQSGVIFVFNAEKTIEYKEYEKNRKIEKEAKKFQKVHDAKALLGAAFDTAIKEKINQTKESEKSNDPLLRELKAQCEEKGYPKKEWQTLNKMDITEYLKSKEL